MISNEDYQLSVVHQLGSLLEIYRLKPGYIRFLRITGLIIFVIGIFSLFFALIPRPNTPLDPITPALFASLYAIILGGVFYSIMTWQALSMRVIICESGLLQIKKIFRRNKVEVVRWKDILTIRKEFLSQGCFITYRDVRFKSLTISSSYQDARDLVVLIRQLNNEVKVDPKS